MIKLIAPFSLFLILLWSTSCQPNTEQNEKEKVSGYSFLITDSSYNRLTDDNIDEIVKGYVKEEMSNIYAFKKIKKEGEVPYLLVAFEKNKFIHFHSVKKQGNTWATQWEDSLNEDQGMYIRVSDWKFNEEKDYTNEGLGNTITLEGCYPHNCMNQNAIFYYDTKNEKGYVDIFSDEENFKSFFPFGVPKEYDILKKFEEIILNKLNDSNSTLAEKLKHITDNILALPSSRIIPQMPPSNNVNKLATQILKKSTNIQNLNEDDYSCNTIFLLDYNEDNYLDYLLIVTDSKKENLLKNGIYIYSGKIGNLIYLDLEDENMTKDISDGMYYPPDKMISYKEQNGDYYLVVAFHEAGNMEGLLDIPYLFKLDKSTFKVVRNIELCTQIITKMGLNIDDYRMEILNSEQTHKEKQGTTEGNQTNSSSDREEKWNLFLTDFTTAMNEKDKKRVIELTSKDFFYGGPLNISKWLDAIFNGKNENITYNELLNNLKAGVNNRIYNNGTLIKTTGTGELGDLFFEYKNSKWLFCGLELEGEADY